MCCPGSYRIHWGTSFCLEALKSALEENKPEIFNTDQGVQFTSTAYTNRLKEAEIQISI